MTYTPEQLAWMKETRDRIYRRNPAFARAQAARILAEKMARVAAGGEWDLSPAAYVEPVIRLGDHITDGCCELARERLGCVCRRSYACEVHGVTCRGSHD